MSVEISNDLPVRRALEEIFSVQRCGSKGPRSVGHREQKSGGLGRPWMAKWAWHTGWLEEANGKR